MNQKYIVLTTEKDKTFARTIAQKLDLPLGEVELKKHFNNETYIHLKTHVNLKQAFLVFSIKEDINDKLIELFFLTNTLKKNGVEKVHLILPRMPYTRVMDLEHAGQNLNLLSRLFYESGIDYIYCCDLFEKIIRTVFRVPIYNISITKIFSKVLDERFYNKNYLVTTNQFYLQKKCKKIADYINGDTFVTNYETIDRKPIFEINTNINDRDVLIVSHDINTAQILTKFASYLALKGARSISVISTHFSPKLNAVELIDKSVIDKLYMATNQKQDSKKIEAISIVNIIVEIIQRIIEDKSIINFIK